VNLHYYIILYIILLSSSSEVVYHYALLIVQLVISTDGCEMEGVFLVRMAIEFAQKQQNGAVGVARLPTSLNLTSCEGV